MKQDKIQYLKERKATIEQVNKQLKEFQHYVIKETGNFEEAGYLNTLNDINKELEIINKKLNQLEAAFEWEIDNIHHD